MQKNAFIASDNRVLCWKRTLMILETDEFHTGDERFSAGDERVENVRST